MHCRLARQSASAGKGERDAFIIVDGLASEDEAARREGAEADAKGFDFNGTGTVLNGRRPSASTGAPRLGSARAKAPSTGACSGG